MQTQMKWFQYVGFGNVFFLSMALLTAGRGTPLSLGIYLTGAVVMTPLFTQAVAQRLGHKRFSLIALFGIGLLIFAAGAAFNRSEIEHIAAPILRQSSPAQHPLVN